MQLLAGGGSHMVLEARRDELAGLNASMPWRPDGRAVWSLCPSFHSSDLYCTCPG